jgi:hypothetical protein
MPNLEKSFQDWATRQQIQDLDAKRASRSIYEAGWAARGNVWANTVGVIFFLAFLAYFATILNGN